VAVGGRPGDVIFKMFREARNCEAVFRWSCCRVCVWSRYAFFPSVHASEHALLTGPGVWFGVIGTHPLRGFSLLPSWERLNIFLCFFACPCEDPVWNVYDDHAKLMIRRAPRDIQKRTNLIQRHILSSRGPKVWLHIVWLLLQLYWVKINREGRYHRCLRTTAHAFPGDHLTFGLAFICPLSTAWSVASIPPSFYVFDVRHGFVQHSRAAFRVATRCELGFVGLPGSQCWQRRPPYHHSSRFHCFLTHIPLHIPHGTSD
jgi:hypothetical protein